MKKKDSEDKKTYYYLIDIVDKKLYSNLLIVNEYTTLSTTERNKCVLYVSLQDAVNARKRTRIETLNIMTIQQ